MIGSYLKIQPVTLNRLASRLAASSGLNAAIANNTFIITLRLERF